MKQKSEVERAIATAKAVVLRNRLKAAELQDPPLATRDRPAEVRGRVYGSIATGERKVGLTMLGLRSD